MLNVMLTGPWIFAPCRRAGIALGTTALIGSLSELEDVLDAMVIDTGSDTGAFGTGTVDTGSGTGAFGTGTVDTGSDTGSDAGALGTGSDTGAEVATVVLDAETGIRTDVGARPDILLRF